MRHINKSVGYVDKIAAQLIDYGHEIGEYTDRMEEIDDLLEKYYYQFLEKGYSCKSAADKAHQQVQADGIPYEEHSLVSLSNLYHKEARIGLPSAPHHVRQSMSDWDIEHQECIGHALEEGIDNFDAMLSFAEAQMSHVDTPHLKQLWGKLKGES